MPDRLDALVTKLAALRDAATATREAAQTCGDHHLVAWLRDVETRCEREFAAARSAALGGGTDD